MKNIENILLLPVPCTGAHWNALSLDFGSLRKAFSFWVLDTSLAFPGKGMRMHVLSALKSPQIYLQVSTAGPSLHWDFSEAWSRHLEFLIIKISSLCDLPLSTFIQEIVDSAWWHIPLTLQPVLRIHCFYLDLALLRSKSQGPDCLIACILLCHSLL